MTDQFDRTDEPPAPRESRYPARFNGPSAMPSRLTR